MKTKLAVATAFACLVLPATAFGQATRTWVSGVGDDVNPCSRTAPCKTWAGAISKTARGGEINALDPGGYGALTITKSITIDGQGTMASTLASSTNGFIVNITDPADTTKRVILRNLSVNGTNGTNFPGQNGINILSVNHVLVQNVDIFGFGASAGNAGIRFASSRPASMDVVDSTVVGNTRAGIFVTAPAGNSSWATIRNSVISANGEAGLQVVTSGGQSAFVGAFGNLIDMNFGDGVLSDGGASAVRLGNNQIVSNARGLRSLNGGPVISFGDNYVASNEIDGVPTAIVAKQ